MDSAGMMRPATIVTFRRYFFKQTLPIRPSSVSRESWTALSLNHTLLLPRLTINDPANKGQGRRKLISMRNAPAKLLLPRAAVATRTNLLNKKVALPSPRGETGDVGQSAQREYCVMISSSAAHRGVTSQQRWMTFAVY